MSRLIARGFPVCMTATTKFLIGAKQHTLLTLEVYDL